MEFTMRTFPKDIDIRGLYTFYYFERGKDFYFAGERHDFWEMVYVDSGEISVVADGVGYILRQGEIIFHKPVEIHTLASNHKDPHNIMVVTFSAKGGAMKFFENKILSVDGAQKKILSRLLTEAREVFGSLAEEKDGLPLNAAPIGAPQMIVNYIEQFLIALIRGSGGLHGARVGRKSAHAKKNVENALVDAAEKYLSEHVRDGLTLRGVCEHFSVSKSYLCKLFHEETGESVIRRYIALKIAEAKRLIRQGDLNFTQIAEALGYAGIHHFTRSFKRMAGVSPSAYAKSVK
jgi:AraC-like DNA-binding protein